MGYSQPKRLEERLAYEVVVLLGMTALALLQVTLLPAPLGFPPALLLVLVVCRVLVGLRSSTPDQGTTLALRWAFYGGIALDLLSSTPLGSHALALLAAAVLVFMVARRLQVAGPMLPLVSVFLGGIVYEGVLALVYAATVHHLVWQTYAVIVIMPSVLFAFIPTLPIFFVMLWLSQQRFPSRNKEPTVTL
jgi:cell shape-determining protein MreD